MSSTKLATQEALDQTTSDEHREKDCKTPVFKSRGTLHIELLRVTNGRLFTYALHQIPTLGRHVERNSLRSRFSTEVENLSFKV